MTPDEIERIETRLLNVEKALNLWSERMGKFEALIHSPGDCELKEKVGKLELHNAKQMGVFVTIGFIVTAITATISGIIVKVWK